jgi:beta-glucuronidase
LTPPKRQLTKEGSADRYLLSGRWQMRRASERRWRGVTVPNAFNAGDPSNASQRGTVVWYRKSFRTPSRSRSLDWIVRFESIRYRANVYLNGRLQNRHDGGYLPFEVKLNNVRPGKVNRLMVRVDNRRRETDLPPSRVSIEGSPGGGWWNYGGILADVYLKKVDRLDIRHPAVRTRLRSRTSSAQIQYQVPVANHGRRPMRANVVTTFGGRRLALGSKTVRPGQSETFKGTLTFPRPRLWTPGDPNLYNVQIRARRGGRTLSTYKLRSGIRTVGVRDGRLNLNHLPVNLQGGFMHLDEPGVGGAMTPRGQEAMIARLKSLGGTTMRTHYPFTPLMHEIADREGVMLWEEIPVYQLASSTLKRPGVISEALRQLRENVRAHQNHPSVYTWSLGNELDPKPEVYESRYYTRGARLVKRLDPTRPVSYVLQGYPLAGKQSAYRAFDLIGVNSYFGWYPGPGGSVADRDELSEFLDLIRSWYPSQAIMITEFGAEANRSGPFEERGTYEFQSEFYDFHLRTYATKPWLSGTIGMLQEFWCRPRWSGGNPHPSEPGIMHQKGVFRYDGTEKPAASVLRSYFRRTQQYDIGAGS